MKLDLAQIITLINGLNVCDIDKINEHNDIGLLRNIVIHHNLVVLGETKNYKDMLK